MFADYDGVDFWGNDKKFVLLDDKESCRQVCNEDPACQFYTYLSSSFNDPVYRFVLIETQDMHNLMEMHICPDANMSTHTLFIVSLDCFGSYRFRWPDRKQRSKAGPQESIGLVPVINGNKPET